ncbi:MAG: glycosyltransferase [Gemmatimonadota bacterium]|nr:glycosyltransferase [Gemmatimonadota bacterium]
MLPEDRPEKSIAVLIPCYNEEATIGKVIRDFRETLPEARIYVFDNNSTDRTKEIAVSEGAEVIREKRQGKGFVVSSMFDRIIADYYVMVDGDDTYPAEYAPQMIGLLESGDADMVVANRMASYLQTKTRPMHNFGNKLVRSLINGLNFVKIKDPMSGYRAFNYDSVMAMPFLSHGFEIETEMTFQALYRKLVIREIDITYRDRPAESESKLNTFKDGFRVLFNIVMLLKAYKPITFFGLLSSVFFLAGMGSGWVVVEEFIKTRFITHVPLAILTGIFFTLGFSLFVTGLIIHTINFRLLESSILNAKQMKHLRQRLP